MFVPNSCEDAIIVFRLTAQENSGIRRITIKDRRSKITILSKTFGRRGNLARLVASIRGMYPRIPVLLADDGIPSNVTLLSNWDLVSFYQLPFDVGLSAARNFLLQHVKTPFVFVCDDDFLFDPIGTDLSLMLDVQRSGFDIVGVRSPVDEDLWGFAFAGNITVENGSLVIGSRAERRIANFLCGCKPVDIVQNIFLARSDILRKIRWDDVLKLGEHEDFFLRAKRAGTHLPSPNCHLTLAGVRVASCSSVWITHAKTKVEAVEAMKQHNRRRAITFMKIALRKHRLTRLISFGEEVVRRDDEYNFGSSLCAFGSPRFFFYAACPY